MTKLSLIYILLLGFCLQTYQVNAQTRRSKKAQVKKATSAKSKNKTSTKIKKNAEETLAVTPKVNEPVDTIKTSSVTITSSYKPTLKSAAKINFTASPSVIDTNRFVLNYSIPAQNLFFSYQPVPIKPIGLVEDSTLVWKNSNYVKIGYGNFKTPFLETALSFGHPNSKVYTIKANYVKSTADVAFQEFTKANINAEAQLNSTNTESIIGIAYNLSQQNRYGITSGVFTSDALRNNFNTIDLYGSVKNKTPNEKGITYNPTIKLNYFLDNKDGSELNAFLNVPIQKKLNDQWDLKLGFLTDLANFKNSNGLTQTTNIVSVQPGFTYNSQKFQINAGLFPTWSNSEFALLPNILAQTNLISEKFVFFLGWQSNYSKNSYLTLTTINPFIIQPSFINNTKLSEQYAGFKGSLNKHISFNAQVGLQNFTNLPLFVNDTAAFKSQDFLIINEPSTSALNIKAEVNYTNQDKISIAIAAKITQFTKQQLFDKVFGFMPLEISGMARYKLFKDLQLKADANFFGGSPFRTKNLQSERLNAALDINVGAEFAVLNKMNVWLQVNNLLNNKYQLWNQYDVLSLNLVGGIKFNF